MSTNAQVVGLWLVEELWVGEEDLTPIAKWTRINADGSFQSGNGWLQNSAGTWTFNEKEMLFSTQVTLSFGEENPPFFVSFKDENMIWHREEAGRRVEIVWSAIKELPMSPADQCVGLWQPVESDEIEAIHLRWDRVYREYTESGRSSGYWYMNAYKPEIILFTQNDNKVALSWHVTFENGEMIWKGSGHLNKDYIIRFRRLNKFPQ